MEVEQGQEDAPKEDGLGVKGRLIIQERFVVHILIIVELPVASCTFFVMPRSPYEPRTTRSKRRIR